MKKLKIPKYSLFALVTLPELKAVEIQKICAELGYDLSIDECKHLWTMYCETFYDVEDKIDKTSIQKAINYIEKGVIWSCDFD